VSDVENPDLLAHNLVVDVVWVSHDGKFANVGLLSFRCQEREVGKARHACLDRCNNRAGARRGAFVKIGED
jgi:hypothetical protein